MPVLTNDEIDRFLSEREILLRIGVNGLDGFPLVTPIWFIYDDQAVYFTPRGKSAWFECLRADARVSLCIDEEAQPYRKILIKGTAELVHDVGEDDKWREMYLSMASRYVPEAGARAYVNNTIKEPRGLYRVNLATSSVKSWRMPVADEDPMGIWHQRYYRPETRF